MAESALPVRPWGGALAGLLALWLLIAGLYRHTLGVMVATWSGSETYAHGFVVPLISLWLVWRIRRKVLEMTPSPSPTAWLALGAVCLLWFAGDLVAVNVVTQLALVLMFVLAVPALLGWSVSRAIAFPLGFLLFAVPVGDFMLPQLMEWTADFTVLALRWSGIPVYREGLQFVIPSGTWSVVEACSGIRYLIASLTVGCLFAYLSYRSMTKRLLFVLVSLVVPLVANWLRAYMIVMIGHLSGNELATGVDHLIYGWVFFGIVIMTMLMLGARWSDDHMLPEEATVAAGLKSSVSAANGTRVGVALLAVSAVLGVPLLLHALIDRSNSMDLLDLRPPLAMAPWTLSGSPPADLAPGFVNPSATAAWGYLDGKGNQVGLHLSYYRQQGYERKLVSSDNALAPLKNAPWAQLSVSSAATSLAGQATRVSEAVLREQLGGLTADSMRLLTWRFYWVNGRFTSSDLVAKLQGALSRVLGRGDDGAIVVVFTPVSRQVAEDEALRTAGEVLQRFVQAEGLALEEALKKTRDGH